MVTVRTAEARGLSLLKDASADATVLTLKAFEALAQMAQGSATTILIPSDLAGVAGAVSALTQVSQATGRRAADS